MDSLLIFVISRAYSLRTRVRAFPNVIYVQQLGLELATSALRTKLSPFWKIIIIVVRNDIFIKFEDSTDITTLTIQNRTHDNLRRLYTWQVKTMKFCSLFSLLIFVFIAVHGYFKIFSLSHIFFKSIFTCIDLMK